MLPRSWWGCLFPNWVVIKPPGTPLRSWVLSSCRNSHPPPSSTFWLSLSQITSCDQCKIIACEQMHACLLGSPTVSLFDHHLMVVIVLRYGNQKYTYSSMHKFLLIILHHSRLCLILSIWVLFNAYCSNKKATILSSLLLCSIIACKWNYWQLYLGFTGTISSFTLHWSCLEKYRTLSTELMWANKITPYQ